MLAVEKVPILNSLVNDIDLAVSQSGIQDGMRAFAKKSGTRIETRFASDETEETLHTKPVLIVGNHPHKMEPLVIMASTPNRPDFYILGNMLFKPFVPSLNPHILELSILHNIQASRDHVLMLCDKVFGQTSEDSAFKKAMINAKSIDCGANLVSQGASVTILPDAVSNHRNHDWFAGVGLLLKRIDPETEASVVFAHIQGTSGLDYLRVIPQIGVVLPRITANYAKPISVSEFQRTVSSEDLTKLLQTKYQRWVNTLN